MSRKLYYSGGKRLEFVNRLEAGLDPDELVAPLLCGQCEDRFDVSGEREVLKHVIPKLVLKPMPLAERMSWRGRGITIGAPRATMLAILASIRRSLPTLR